MRKISKPAAVEEEAFKSSIISLASFEPSGLILTSSQVVLKTFWGSLSTVTTPFLMTALNNQQARS